jgi:Iron-containing redox enzyme
MPSLSATSQDLISPSGVSLQSHVESGVNELLASLPKPEHLSAEERRGIIARYSAVLEGNFIYWMTGAWLSVKSEQSRVILLRNLYEEVRDCHPGMLRRFAIAAHAFPSASDALAISPELTDVRLFIGRLSGTPVVLMMGFFECFIQGFMAYLAKLAELQGSAEMEYTQVHGVCDVVHTQELFQALGEEMALAPPESDADLFEGVDLLTTLVRSIVSLQPVPGKFSICRG